MKAGMREIGNKAFTMATGTRRSENENAQHPPYEEITRRRRPLYERYSHQLFSGCQNGTRRHGSTGLKLGSGARKAPIPDKLDSHQVCPAQNACRFHVGEADLVPQKVCGPRLRTQARPQHHTLMMLGTRSTYYRLIPTALPPNQPLGGAVGLTCPE